MRYGKATGFFGLVLLLGAACSTSGGNKTDGGGKTDGGASATDGASPASDGTVPGTDGGAATSTNLALLGRSVTEGWFAHWEAEGSYSRGRFYLQHNIWEPYDPDVQRWPEQAAAVIKAFPGKAGGRKLRALQYKHCFVDFTDDTDLTPYKRIAEAVYKEVVTNAKLKLIVGNALPWTTAGMSATIKKKQLEWNAYLADLAAKHPGEVFVFDQYAVLTDSAGALKAEYAVAADDAHLNKAGYDALDAAYFAFLARTLP